MSADRWLPGVASPAARVRLFCFPFAGGAASFYRSWIEELRPAIDVRPVLLPGRERRMAEPPERELARLIVALQRGLAPAFDLPYAFFGHSMGALIAFELTRALRRTGTGGPVRLFISAHRAPSIAGRRRYHELDDAELRGVLRRLGGSPEAALEHDELMELLLPTIRADFELCETYRYDPGAPLDVPITVFAGREDREVPPGEVDGWRDESTAGVDIHILEGGHFFLDRARDQVLSSIAAALGVAAAGRSGGSPT